MVTHIQAILFKKDFFTIKQANAFLKQHILEKIKPFHITNKYIRCRLIEPNYKNINIKFLRFHLKLMLFMKL